MRGDDRRPEPMFSYVSAEERIPRDHPLRAIRTLVDDVLRDMSRDFSRVYATTGRPSIPPEQLLRALRFGEWPVAFAADGEQQRVDTGGVDGVDSDYAG